MARKGVLLAAVGTILTVLPRAFAVISRNDPVTGYATFYGGPQV